MANIGIENTDCETLRQLKAIQATNCRKTKPWLKSTGSERLRVKKGSQKFTKQAG
jgi:ribosomal protein L40E